MASISHLLGIAYLSNSKWKYVENNVLSLADVLREGNRNDAEMIGLAHLYRHIEDGNKDCVIKCIAELSSHNIQIPSNFLLDSMELLQRKPGKPKDNDFATLEKKWLIAEMLGVKRALYFSKLAYKNLEEAHEAARSGVCFRGEYYISESTLDRIEKEFNLHVVWGEVRCMKGLTELGKIDPNGAEIKKWRKSLRSLVYLSYWKEDDPQLPWADNDGRWVQEMPELLNLE